jgi:hypothetical protein
MLTCDFCIKPFNDLNKCKLSHSFCDECALVTDAQGSDFSICSFCPKCSEVKPIKAKKQNPPNEFFCPITHEMMVDPVVLTDGFSYEREAIVDWMKLSAISPMTGATVVNSIVANTVLNIMINEWKQI